MVTRVGIFPHKEMFTTWLNKVDLFFQKQKASYGSVNTMSDRSHLENAFDLRVCMYVCA